MSAIPVAKNKVTGASARPQLSESPADNVIFDWWMAIVTCVMIFGLFIDGWAHNHGRVDNTFFTPWHAILYGAYALSAISLLTMHFRNVSKGYRWNRALPAGYMPALLGAFIFAVAGMGDMLWHGAFGFEENLETLLSPTHLILASAGLLINSGPVRALWQRHCDANWRSLFPAILAITAITSVFTFFMAFAAVTGKTSLLTGLRPQNSNLTDQYGVQALVVHSNILLGVILFIWRRWQLPFGTITFIYAINALLMVWLHLGVNAEFLLVVSAAFAGLLGDLLLRVLSKGAAANLRIFAFTLPFAYSLGALLVLHVLGTTAWGRGGLWWEIHMWLGAPVLAGVVGYGLSLLVHPPVLPHQST